ncbi:OppA family ABC transporter substrate-binding lipoprotein [Mycoplasma anserisalpingitidis]|uniref:Uncharacterized protein n=1 Tax=Mycoplasma anserisalpingitidis TaxID=519450 RepID=A0A5B8JGJ0_9MOLU|nr:hypothetical protein [Mycoplasma anserisalpingitidis]QDY88343.1 hypothetical protein FOY43_01535 [Mycoplasma anserisalpingitidis]
MKKRLLLTSATIAVGPLAFLSASCSNPSSNTPSKPVLTDKNIEGSLQIGDKGWTNELDADKITDSLSSNLKDKLQSSAKNGIYTQFFNSTYTEGAYPFESSMVSGTLSGTLSELTYGKLFEYEYVGKPLYKTKTVVTGLKTEEVITVLRPSVKKMSFDLADQIILTVDGVEKVYDSDDIDSVEDKLDKVDPNKGWTTSVVKGFSSNPRSINSAQFAADLEKSTKLSFRIRPNQYWVDKNGEKTKYKVVADDFRISALRTLVYADATFRRSNGSSLETDKLISNQFDRSPSTFTSEKPTGFNNKYLFTLFNVSFDDLIDPSKSLSADASGNTYFTFNMLDSNSQSRFAEYLPKLLTDSTFLAAPSEYIKENSAKKDLFYVQSSKADANLIKDTIANLPDGAVRESGIFWYGTNVNNTLFSSRYYTSGYNANSYATNYKVNTHYHDQEWVNNSSTIKTFTEQYAQAPDEPNLWIDKISNQFLSGMSPNIRTNELNSDAKAAATEIGFSYAQSGNKDQIARRNFWNFAPLPGSDNSWLAYMNGDSVFYDVLYGYSVQELNSSKSLIESNGASKNYLTIGEVLKQSTTGAGMEFRTILLSALNLSAVSNTINPNNEVRPWNNSFAYASPISSNTTNTLVDFYDEVTQTFVVNSLTGERYTFEINGENTKFMNVKDNSTFGVESDKKFQSIIFDQLSEKMTALLDRIYQEKGFSESTKVQIRIPWRYSNMLDAYNQAHNGIVDTWTRLDKKGRLQIEYEQKRLSDEELTDKLYKFFAGFSSITPLTYSGWTYDYENIGSGLDGYNNALNLHLIFALVATDNEYKEKLEKSYPELVRAGLAFVEFAKTKRVSIPVELWPSLTLEDANNLSSYLGQYTYNKDTKEFKLIPDSETSNYDSLNTITAEFWLDYQTKSLTDEQAVALVREIGNTQLIPFDGQGSISASKFVKQIVNPYYTIPASDGPMNVWNITTNLK